IAKHSPCAGRIIAVLTPITSPRVVTNGPPELPGLSAASVWMTSSMSRPERDRSDRPSALTTPAVTEWWKPYGLPIAIATCPTRTPRESPNVAQGSAVPSIRMTARSVSVSCPTTSARLEWPSGMTTARGPASATTWLLVRMRPSGVKRTPEPPPRPASILTTAGPTISTARITACEYASSSSSSSGWERSRWGATVRLYGLNAGRRTTQTGRSRIWNLEFGIWNLECRTNSKFQIGNSKFQSALSLDFPARAAHDASGFGAGVLAVLQDLNPIHPHVPYAGRVLMGLLVCRMVGDGRGIEHDHVGEAALRKTSPFCDSQRGGGERRELPDRFFDRDHVLVTKPIPVDAET